MFSGWPFLPHLLQQQFQFFFHTEQGIVIPVRGIQTLSTLPDPSQQLLQALFCGHGYTRTRSFACTAAVTALPSPMTTRSPVIWITLYVRA